MVISLNTGDYNTDSSNFDEITRNEAEIANSNIVFRKDDNSTAEITDSEETIIIESISKVEIHEIELSQKKVIITIPAYNEADVIEEVIQRISNVMLKTKYQNNFTIHVVDDGSTDETVKISKQAGALVYSHEKNSGLAETFRSEIYFGLKMCGDIIVHIDADGQYRAEEIPKLLAEIENGFDLVLGSRFTGLIEHMPFVKKIGNRIFSKITSRITKKKISDSQTGFRAFTREVAEEIIIISTHTYTQEQIIKANAANFEIIEIPIHFDARKNGKSRLIKNSIEYAIRAIITFYRIYFEKNKKK